MRRNSRGLVESSVQWKSVLEIKNGPGWEGNFDDCHIMFRSSIAFYGQLPNPGLLAAERPSGRHLGT